MTVRYVTMRYFGVQVTGLSRLMKQLCKVSDQSDSKYEVCNKYSSLSQSGLLMPHGCV